MLKKFFTLIICAAFVNLFGACTAQKEVPQEMLNDYVTLTGGYKMPLIGFGTWTLDDDAAEVS